MELLVAVVAPFASGHSARQGSFESRLAVLMEQTQGLAESEVSGRFAKFEEFEESVV